MSFLKFSIFCLLFLGTLAEDECDTISPYQKCRHYVPYDKMDEINVVPDAEELREICPGNLKYFECFTEHLDDCGKMNEHYTVIEFLENAYEITKDLCDESSDLHLGYSASAECYKTLDETGDICSYEAKVIYEAYFQYLEKEHPERVEAVFISSQKICMTESYRIACLSEKVLKSCGESAQAILMEIVSRSQYLRQFCSQSMIEEMKTAFLSQLDKEADDLEIYQSAFSVMKRK